MRGGPPWTRTKMLCRLNSCKEKSLPQPIAVLDVARVTLGSLSTRMRGVHAQPGFVPHSAPSCTPPHSLPSSLSGPDLP